MVPAPGAGSQGIPAWIARLAIMLPLLLVSVDGLSYKEAAEVLEDREEAS